MYHWIEDKEYLTRVKSTSADIMNQLVQLIKAEGKMEVMQHLVGSGAKNLIVQNGQEPIDLDYNLEIVNFGNFRENDCRAIKNYIMEKFNEILNANGWGDCQDSTSAITTEKRAFKKGNRTLFSIDLCITYKSNDQWRRLIHHKTGFVSHDQYYWNNAFKSEGLENRVAGLKKNPKIWNEVRNVYLDKKNMYLRSNDHDHPSFIIYIETINEIYNKYCQQRKYDGYDVRSNKPQGNMLTYGDLLTVRNVRR